MSNDKNKDMDEILRCAVRIADVKADNFVQSTINEVLSNSKRPKDLSNVFVMLNLTAIMSYTFKAGFLSGVEYVNGSIQGGDK